MDALIERDAGAERTVRVVQGDMTRIEADAITNAANEALAHGAGLALAIARAGGPVIQAESDAWVAQHGNVPTGGAAWTNAGHLPARWVVHAVGPVWRGGHAGEDEALRSAFRASLDQAAELGAQSLALPALSAGIFGFPPDRCAAIAVATLQSWWQENPDAPLTDVVFCTNNADVAALLAAAVDAAFSR